MVSRKSSNQRIPSAPPLGLLAHNIKLIFYPFLLLFFSFFFFFAFPAFSHWVEGVPLDTFSRLFSAFFLNYSVP